VSALEPARSSGISGGGAYGAGQVVAFLFGFVMVAAGVRFLIKYFSARA
jgi:hypothetical protein